MYGHFLQVLLTTFVLSKSANWDLSAESQMDVTVEQAKLINTGRISLTIDVNCTEQGIFPINCTSYQVCIDMGDEFLGAIGTCQEPRKFNPDNNRCDPDYVCQPCSREGFICLTDTSFTLCSDTLNVVVRNVTCPSDHCCNEAHRLPCMNQTLASCCSRPRLWNKNPFTYVCL